MEEIIGSVITSRLCTELVKFNNNDHFRRQEFKLEILFQLSPNVKKKHLSSFLALKVREDVSSALFFMYFYCRTRRNCGYLQ